MPTEATTQASPGSLGAGLAVHAQVFAVVVGLFAAGVLSAGHLLDLPVPCGGSGGCETVAAHPSSKPLGVPIAYVGFGAYALLLLLLGRPVVGPQARRWACGVAGIGTIISAVLLVYAKVVIQATCPWCVVSGVAMTTVFALGLGQLTRRAGPAGPRPWVLWSLLVTAALAIGLQAGRMARAASAPPVPSSRLAEVNADRWVDPAKSLGPSDAAVTIVVWADMFCPACRRAVHSLTAYQQAHPRAVRLVYRHLPLWRIRGHETSRAAAALSEMAGEQGQFWAFVERVHELRRPPGEQDYLHILDQVGLDAAASQQRLATGDDPAVQRVLRDEALAAELRITSTPTFVLLVEGQPPVASSLRRLPTWLNSPVVKDLLARKAAVESER